ncbi:MAG: hypothetical protein HN353_09105 [Bdellovibrionales bacterium]|jgi:hypothetical protein|nr:hypothetical protein [Bdellovibrionales bacterium]MBT3526186.1 hypothetical protein [Bdellovibrionales bacterium]MBT7669276.1 hypothetical protein [Bdellovibrionales bacterium]MBT7767010.1 hypothetical protein [Bdellovibrionales bacterium]
MLQVKSLSSNQDDKFIDDFCNLQATVRQPPYHQANLPASSWKEFLLNRKHFSCEFWLLYDNQVPVARIGANLSQADKQLAYFGFFETDIAYQKQLSPLFDQLHLWMRTNHVVKAVGPINYNTWFNYRFKTSSTDDHHHFPWEPINPPEYPAIFTEQGYQWGQKYHTVASGNLPAMVQKSEAAWNRAHTLGYTFRPFNLERFIEDEVELLYRISVEGFKDNYLFSPITLEQFRQLYVGAAKQLDLSYSLFVTAPDGNEVGFFLVFAQGQYIVMKSTTVLANHRGKGLSNAALHQAFTKAVTESKKGYISALMIAGAQSESYSQHGDFLWSHDYHLLEREL